MAYETPIYLLDPTYVRDSVANLNNHVVVGDCSGSSTSWFCIWDVSVPVQEESYFPQKRNLSLSSFGLGH